MQTHDVVTLVIAVYGALLATLSALRQHFLDRPRLKVTMSSALPVGLGIDGTFVCIEAVNHGQRPAVVTGLTVHLPDGRTLALAGSEAWPLPATPLPATLEQGQGAKLYASYSQIGSALLSCDFGPRVRITPLAYRGAGTPVVGKAWHVDPAELAGM